MAEDTENKTNAAAPAETAEKKPEAATPEVALPDPAKLVVSSSPHVHAGGGIKKVMWLVILSLLPACGAGIYYFGLPALEVIILCVVSCVGFEMIFGRMIGHPDAWKDGSAVVTGMILAMNLSAGIPWWVCVLGGLLAIGLGKMVFGGIGHNPFNPAIVARVGLLIGLPALMTTWVPPKDYSYMLDKDAWFFAPSTIKRLKDSGVKDIPFSGELKMKGAKGELEAVTCATPLGIAGMKAEMAKSSGKRLSGDPFAAIANPEAYKRYFWGDVGGCLGETSVFWLLIGAAILFAFGIIRWWIPLSFIGTVAAFTAAVHAASPTLTPGPLFHILTGGVVLGAFFCATDMVTSPMTRLGGILFGVGCGIITCCIRIWGSYPEGVSFSILFMNALVPLIDRWTVGKPFGYRPPPKEDGGKKE